MLFIPIALLVVSGVVYQLSQKLISPGANPAISLICSYIVSICLSFFLFILFPLKNSIASALKDLNIFSFLIAVPIVGIELGYLLLYRKGGNLSFSSALVSSMITLILLTIGIVVFKEQLNAKKIVGIVFCLSGIFLLNLK